MITIDNVRCNGCGDCVEACPPNAITLYNDKAVVDENLCHGCEACLSACPQGAILSVEVIEPVLAEETALVPTRETPLALTPVPTEVTLAARQAASPMLRRLLVPAIGRALAWTGREIVPRLGYLALDLMDRRIRSIGDSLPDRRTGPRTPTLAGSSMAGGSGGRRHRRRRRRHGGRESEQQHYMERKEVR
jgi:NAD-dependent dihydropyrimidine dehydrogenase PreA subunit